MHGTSVSEKTFVCLTHTKHILKGGEIIESKDGKGKCKELKTDV